MLRPGFFGETLIDELFNDFARPAKHAARYEVSVMRTDVKETENGYELEIELPGYKKEDVQAELKDGTLIITASHKAENEEQQGQYIRRERFWGTCSRSFYVGDEVKQEDIKARFEEGILKLFVPKKEEVPEIETNNFISIEG